MNIQHKRIAAMSLCAAVAGPGLSFGALIDRGGGLIYDDVLNVTWLQDVNYALTSGYDANGQLTWSQAETWANGLTYYDNVRGVVWDDWRLPSAGPVNGSTYNFDWQYSGLTDVGYSMSDEGTPFAGSTSNEIAHLYYNSLDNKAYCSPMVSSRCEPQAGVFPMKSGPFINMQVATYWSGTMLYTDGVNTLRFAFGFGDQILEPIGSYAWYTLVVRDGDVASATTVPVSAAAWFFGSGLIGLTGFLRKHKYGRPQLVEAS